MTEKDPRLVESFVRLSKSILWEIQRNYFRSMGINAWKEEVPFYISSNAFIGYHYANIVFNFITDWKRLNPQNRDPFYILEVGSGTGKFSFYFLKAFKAILSGFKETLSFCYIISDVIPGNIQFCQNNPSFQPYIKEKELDFAIFNVEEHKDIALILREQNYSELKSTTPLVIIANYTFDCIMQEAFWIEEGKLHEIQQSIRSRYKNFDVEKSLHLNELRLNYQRSLIDVEGYYENPILTDILKDYLAYFNKQNALIMMPLGAMRFIEHMLSLTNQQFFMIVGDKGVSFLDQFPFLTEEYLATFDGCFAFLLNFHAMGEYLKKSGHDYFLTKNADEFKMNLYCAGTSFSTLDLTRNCFEKIVNCEGPEEYCALFDEFLTSNYRFGIKSLLAFLRYSRWDPKAFSILYERMIELLPIIPEIILYDMYYDLAKVKENIYPINIGDDVYNMLGIFYQMRNDDEDALNMYLTSIALFGDKAPPHNNAAIIYEKQKNSPKALEHYEKSFALDPKNRFANKKIHQLTGKFYFGSIIPFLRAALILGFIILAFYFIGRI